MSLKYWWVFLLLKIIVSSTNNPLLISFSLLIMRFYILLLLLKNFILWYRIIFFLIYVGAVLVLVFYVVCVNCKPIKFQIFWFNLVVGRLVFLLLNYKRLRLYYCNLKILKQRLSLIKINEYYIMLFLFCLLLLILWIIRKLTFLSVGRIRTFV